MRLSDALEIVVRTHPGKVRANNEDAVFADASSGLAILADGMGGHNGGEVASGMMLTLLATNFSEVVARCDAKTLKSSGRPFVHEQIRTQIDLANEAIYNAAQHQPQYAGMGTTLVLTWFYEDQLCVAHVGDSRLYRLRGSVIDVLTRDHSVLQDQIDSGLVAAEDARHSSIRNLLTRALGVAPVVEVEFGDHEVLPGDLFLLCSDGLNDMLTDEQIQHILLAHSGMLDNAADELIEIANNLGGRDNVSVILIKVRAGFDAPQSGWRKLLAWLK